MVDRKKFVGRVLFSSIIRFVGGSSGDDGTYEGISRSTLLICLPRARRCVCL
jgi:hypothetical protein